MQFHSKKYTVVVGGTYVAMIGLAVDPELQRLSLRLRYPFRTSGVYPGPQLDNELQKIYTKDIYFDMY